MGSQCSSGWVRLAATSSSHATDLSGSVCVSFGPVLDSRATFFGRLRPFWRLSAISVGLFAILLDFSGLRLGPFAGSAHIPCGPSDPLGSV